MTEIRWHGRGGQGAKTAAHLFAMAELKTGKYVQAFPEYGPERSGSPVHAYDRVDDRPIRRHYGVREPHVVVVLDDTLLTEVDVARGLSPDGLLLVNTTLTDEVVATRTGYAGRIWCLPGDALARSAGGHFANVVLLGSLARAVGPLPWEAVEDAVRELLGRRLAQAALERTLAAAWFGYAWTEGRAAR